MYKFLLLLPIFLTSCGLPLVEDLIEKDESHRQFNSTNPVFNSYITSFEQAAKEQNGGDFTVGDIPINFGDTQNSSYRGVCIVYTSGEREILIQESWWNHASESYKESLIFHELGHCRLNRGHDNSTVAANEQDYKASLMNQNIVSPGHYNPHRAGYLAELFRHDKTVLQTSLTSDD